MTDLPYFTGTPRVHTAYTHCTYACVALALSAGVASADGWVTFRDLCLIPAEVFQEYSAEMAAPVAADWGLAEGEAGYRVEGGPEVVVFETAPVDGRRACRVHAPDGAKGFADWFAQMQGMSRYLPDPHVTTEGVTAFMSNQIVEPVLSAQLWHEGEGVVMRILETGRES